MHGPAPDPSEQIGLEMCWTCTGHVLVVSPCGSRNYLRLRHLRGVVRRKCLLLKHLTLVWHTLLRRRWTRQLG